MNVGAFPLFLFFPAAVAVLWAGLACRVWVEAARAPHLPLAPPESGQDLPLVSLLLPARNEADRMLAACVRSLLAQDYPRCEIIAVDDRSTDGTGDLLRALAGECNGRMTVLSGVPPPDGWVGKQHALMQAARSARGEWLLAVDADALYEPTVVRDAVCRARALRLDALSLLPRVGAGDFWVSVMFPVGVWALLVAAPPRRVNRPGTMTGLAWGGFFLWHRAAFDAVGGYASVRGETSEDTKLAAYLKRRGFRLRVELAMDRLYTPMYPTFGDLWRGALKNVYCGPVATPLVATGLALLGVLPAAVVPIACLRHAWALALLGGASWLLSACALVPVYRMHRIAPWRAVFGPLGAALCVAQMFWATWLIAITGRGIEWRGRRLRVSPAAPGRPSDAPAPCREPAES